MVEKNAYQGVILAAGNASRMGPFGRQFPKTIAPICNKPLLAYQLEYMRDIGIRDVIIVIGHLGHRVTRILGDGAAFGVHIDYIEQEKRLGLAHAVGQLEPYVDRQFLLMLGDIFFDSRDLGAMLSEFEDHDAAAVLAVKQETDPEIVKLNSAVLMHDDGTVRRIIEKPRHVPTMLRTVGLYLFNLQVFDAIRRTPRTAMRDEYELTDSIQILIDYDYAVRIAPVVEWDVNVTYIRDLIACCRHQLGRLGKDALVGDHCNLAEGVELNETVLGEGVTIAKPAHLERCVVLPGVRLEGGRTYMDMVITKDAHLHAAQDT